MVYEVGYWRAVEVVYEVTGILENGSGGVNRVVTTGKMVDKRRINYPQWYDPSAAAVARVID